MRPFPGIIVLLHGRKVRGHVLRHGDLLVSQLIGEAGGSKGPGCPDDFLEKFMKELGLDAVRFRVWVDPSRHGGWNSKEDILVKAKRANDLGMAIMVDFHYSDFWADPKKQNIPEAWSGKSYEEIKVLLAEHTKDVLSALKAEGIEARWVQVGNEISNGFHQPLYDSNLDTLRKYGAKWDIIGMSLYPYWALDSGLETDEEEAITHCEGIFYWEPECRPFQYRLRAFDSEGDPPSSWTDLESRGPR